MRIECHPDKCDGVSLGKMTATFNKKGFQGMIFRHAGIGPEEARLNRHDGRRSEWEINDIENAVQ